MRIDSAATAAVRGIQNGLREVQESAATVASRETASGTEDPARLTQALVDLKSGERQVEASAKVFRAHDETVGTLLDITA